MARVSVIILNYNGTRFTVDCLRALEKQTFKDFEVILIDNGSSDENLGLLRTYLNTYSTDIPLQFKHIDKNLGFSGGNNIGLEYTKGVYIALLNNDAEPDSRWLQELVNAMDRNPAVGICASKILVHGSSVIDSAGDGFVRSLKGYKRGEGESAENFSSEEFVFGACAGAALYRREMIGKIGFLDEEFFLIHEDSDLNFRAQLTGWKVLYVPRAIVYHKVRSSIGRWSDLEVYYTLRNSYLVKVKNAPLGLALFCLPEILAATITEFIYFVVRHGKGMLYFRAIGGALLLLPSMLRKRKANLSGKKATNKCLWNMMVPIFSKDIFKTKLKKLFYD
ncbi:MAG: glycosyltransferase family 2 protein [Syntrophorhabdaceae bacterium]|nr:glycosyltransferase family 2 protein [Syntrophorhabdaceae bacterium]MDD5243128.1 glycosyltransferase family 2 protein [Syntrophorhabdaceae bacterium]